MSIKLTMLNFEKEVMQSELPVLIDFSADWCGPCRMMSPLIEELVTDLEGTAKVCKVDVEVEKELARQFNVTSIPLLVVMEKGKVVKTSLGFQSKEQIRTLL